LRECPPPGRKTVPPQQRVQPESPPRDTGATAASARARSSGRVAIQSPSVISSTNAPCPHDPPRPIRLTPLCLRYSGTRSSPNPAPVPLPPSARHPHRGWPMRGDIGVTASEGKGMYSASIPRPWHCSTACRNAAPCGNTAHRARIYSQSTTRLG